MINTSGYRLYVANESLLCSMVRGRDFFYELAERQLHILLLSNCL